ncbi:MAG: anti-sigma factor family protein [Ilumatobacteraceae bacterium]
MADCQETLNELHRYLDEELSAERVGEILGHLKICSDCTEAYEFHAVYKETIRTKAQREELSEGFLDRLKECFGDEFPTTDEPNEGPGDEDSSNN